MDTIFVNLLAVLMLLLGLLLSHGYAEREEIDDWFVVRVGEFIIISCIVCFILDSLWELFN